MWFVLRDIVAVSLYSGHGCREMGVRVCWKTNNGPLCFEGHGRASLVDIGLYGGAVWCHCVMFCVAHRSDGNHNTETWMRRQDGRCNGNRMLGNRSTPLIFLPSPVLKEIDGCIEGSEGCGHVFQSWGRACVLKRKRQSCLGPRRFGS